MKRLGVAGAALLVAAGTCFAGTLRPVAVQPSGDEVPANLLRISIVFDEHVSEPVLPRLALRAIDGRTIDRPFLEQELWSPTGKILTVLLHPGRVKSGLIAHDTSGPVLTKKKTVSLTLDGRELKRWVVADDDHEGPATARWRIGTVRAGSRDPLVVALDAPIDGRDVDYLVVADSRNRRLPGRAVLVQGEGRWSFKPAAAWQAGKYRLAVFSQLEDSAGNRLGGRFERTTGQMSDRNRDASIPFSIR